MEDVPLKLFSSCYSFLLLFKKVHNVKTKFSLLFILCECFQLHERDVVQALERKIIKLKSEKPSFNYGEKKYLKLDDVFRFFTRLPPFLAGSNFLCLQNSAASSPVSSSKDGLITQIHVASHAPAPLPTLLDCC